MTATQNKPEAGYPPTGEASGHAQLGENEPERGSQHCLTFQLSNGESATPLEWLRSDTSTFRMS